jgi:hypothetical protein
MSLTPNHTDGTSENRITSHTARLRGDSYERGMSKHIDLEKSQEQQKNLILSGKLPRDCDEWWLLRNWGVKITDSNSDLFFNVRLPDGWQIVATGDVKWSNLLDEQGLRRATIYFNATERRSYMRVFEGRYALRENRDEKGALQYNVVDLLSIDERIVYQTPIGHYGFLMQDSSKVPEVGFILEDKFYWDVKVVEKRFLGMKERTSLDSDSRFSLQSSSSLACPMNQGEFYQYPQPYFFNVAARKLLTNIAIPVLEQLEKESASIFRPKTVSGKVRAFIDTYHIHECSCMVLGMAVALHVFFLSKEPLPMALLKGSVYSGASLGMLYYVVKQNS